MNNFIFENSTKTYFGKGCVKEYLTYLMKQYGNNVMFAYGGDSIRGNGIYGQIVGSLAKAGKNVVEFSGICENPTYKKVMLAACMILSMALSACGGTVDTVPMEAEEEISIPESESKRTSRILIAYYSKPTDVDTSNLDAVSSASVVVRDGAVAADSQADDFGTAYGIPADYAVLVPKYSMSLGREMTAYTALVTVVQLSASTIGDRNPVSYDMGISVIRNVLKAAEELKENPDNSDARGVVLYGASIATSGRLGIGKEENYSYDIYEVEFIPEVLFGVSYRKSLTTLFPRFLKVMASYHEEEIRAFIKDAFGYEGEVAELAEKIVALFTDIGIDMYFDGEPNQERISSISVDSMLKQEEIVRLIEMSMR